MITKVYIVSDNSVRCADYLIDFVIKVFPSMELAEEYCKKIQNRYSIVELEVEQEGELK